MPCEIEAGLQADQRDGVHSLLEKARWTPEEPKRTEMRILRSEATAALPNRAQNGCIPKSSAVIGSTDTESRREKTCSNKL